MNLIQELNLVHIFVEAKKKLDLKEKLNPLERQVILASLQQELSTLKDTPYSEEYLRVERLLYIARKNDILRLLHTN